MAIALSFTSRVTPRLFTHSPLPSNTILLLYWSGTKNGGTPADTTLYRYAIGLILHAQLPGSWGPATGIGGYAWGPKLSINYGRTLDPLCYARLQREQTVRVTAMILI